MNNIPTDPMRDVMQLLSRLPGIGERTAQRLTFHLMREAPDFSRTLAEALVRLSQEMRLCPVCHHFTSQEKCVFCQDSRRETGVLCVVASSQDLLAVEACGEFRGRYHVLGGLLSPLEGIGPENLHMADLITRLRTERVQEVILALRPSVEGETTAFYLQRQLSPLGLKVTVIASGIPMGGELEYADRLTLARAFTGRREA